MRERIEVVLGQDRELVDVAHDGQLRRDEHDVPAQLGLARAHRQLRRALLVERGHVELHEVGLPVEHGHRLVEEAAPDALHRPLEPLQDLARGHVEEAPQDDDLAVGLAGIDVLDRQQPDHLAHVLDQAQGAGQVAPGLLHERGQEVVVLEEDRRRQRLVEQALDQDVELEERQNAPRLPLGRRLAVDAVVATQGHAARVVAVPAAGVVTAPVEGVGTAEDLRDVGQQRLGHLVLPAARRERGEGVGAVLIDVQRDLADPGRGQGLVGPALRALRQGGHRLRAQGERDRHRPQQVVDLLVHHAGRLGVVTERDGQHLQQPAQDRHLQPRHVRGVGEHAGTSAHDAGGVRRQDQPTVGRRAVEVGPPDGQPQRRRHDQFAHRSPPNVARHQAEKSRADVRDAMVEQVLQSI